MSVRICADVCVALGHPFMGVEFSHECYCGNERPPQYWVQPVNGDWAETNCDMACTGDHA